MTADIVVDALRRLLDIMGFPSASVISETEVDGRLHLTVTVPEGGRILIGKEGAHLEALQHILHCIVRRHLQPPVSFTLDINNYRRQREQSLTARAGEAAKLAQDLGRPVILEPMSAADRRIVHTTLAQEERVRTESVGEGSRRRVIVRPQI